MDQLSDAELRQGLALYHLEDFSNPDSTDGGVKVAVRDTLCTVPAPVPTQDQGEGINSPPWHCCPPGMPDEVRTLSHFMSRSEASAKWNKQ